MKKEFIGTCVENPFSTVDELSLIIDDRISISKKEFLDNCDVIDEIIQDMKQYKYDYEFFKSQDIYFYKWSRIEHFFK